MMKFFLADCEGFLFFHFLTQYLILKKKLFGKQGQYIFLSSLFKEILIITIRCFVSQTFLKVITFY